MKKILLFLSVVATAVGFTSCNSKSDSWGITFGSLELGNSFTNVMYSTDGTLLEAESGYASFHSP
ncbi:MAG: hypothetical protein LUD68_06950, partial [Rikenellaceae bacterium]|nr:hypothetical protein [Rikenellaceae bacterium]